MSDKTQLIRKIYLYLASLIGLILIVIGTVRLVDLGLKIYIFKQADTFVYYPPYPARIEKDGKEISVTPEEEEKYKTEQEEAQRKEAERQRQSTASNSIAMILVGFPVFFYHWRMVGKEKII